MKENEIVALNLKRHRQFKGLSQKELAAKVGLTSDTISKIEMGKQKNIGMKYLVLICRTLDIQMQELFMDGVNHIPLKLVISDEALKTAEKILTMIVKRK